MLAATSARRLLLYRKLVRRALTGAIRVEIPRAAARLGDGFDAWIARYLEGDLPRSHYLRDVAFEFVVWAAPRWFEDTAVPAYLGDLARHELSSLEIAAAERDDRGPSGRELALDYPVRFDRAMRLHRYEHAVHLLAEDLDARDVPPARSTWLLGYRDREHEVRYLEQSALAAAIVTRLGRGDRLGEAITGACADQGEPVGAAVLEGAASMLADLAERGILLGAEDIEGAP